ncbi:MAG: rhodanese-like domain-containing protein [Bacillota bacterium]
MPQKISPAEAKAWLGREPGIVLLDVRTGAEHRKKTIPGSICLPLDRLGDEAAARLPDRNTVIIVYCQYGGRSAKAAALLEKNGYERVYDLGGIVNWPYETVHGGA